jgi:hypothetical protein
VINLPNIITTAAGNGTQGYSGDGGAATNASLFAPAAMAADGFGNLFIADASNNRVLKVLASNVPVLTVGDLSAMDAGVYQIVISNPCGRVTSTVATLTVVSTNQPPVLAITPPLLSVNNLLLGFSLSVTTSPAFTPLQSASAAGP